MSKTMNLNWVDFILLIERNVRIQVLIMRTEYFITIVPKRKRKIFRRNTIIGNL